MRCALEMFQRAIIILRVVMKEEQPFDLRCASNFCCHVCRTMPKSSFRGNIIFLAVLGIVNQQVCPVGKVYQLLAIGLPPFHIGCIDQAMFSVLNPRNQAAIAGMGSRMQEAHTHIIASKWFYAAIEPRTLQMGL